MSINNLDNKEMRQQRKKNAIRFGVSPEELDNVMAEDNEEKENDQSVEKPLIDENSICN